MDEHPTSAQLSDQPQGFIAGVAVGAIAGGLAALFLTPKNGKEMRALLRDFAAEWEDEAVDMAAELGTILTAFQGAFEGTVEAPHEPVAEKVRSVPERLVDGIEETSERIGEQYRAAEAGVENILRDWRTRQEGLWATPEAAIREVPADQEQSSLAPEDWPTYPVSNHDYYHQFKGGSVSAVAERDSTVVDDVAEQVEPMFSRHAPEEVIEEQPFLAPHPVDVERYTPMPLIERLERTEDAVASMPVTYQSPLLTSDLDKNKPTEITAKRKLFFKKK
jgi:gas vesicle protein